MNCYPFQPYCNNNINYDNPSLNYNKVANADDLQPNCNIQHPGLGSSLNISTSFNTSENPNTNESVTRQIQPSISKLTTHFWEDEKTICYQIELNSVIIARREDNNFINGTKLLNVVPDMTRGRRDGILKVEKQRHVIRFGPMVFKGVWIPLERALRLANRENVVDQLYPLFANNIKDLVSQGPFLKPSVKSRDQNQRSVRYSKNEGSTGQIPLAQPVDLTYYYDQGKQFRYTQAYIPTHDQNQQIYLQQANSWLAGAYTANQGRTPIVNQNSIIRQQKIQSSIQYNYDNSPLQRVAQSSQGDYLDINSSRSRAPQMQEISIPNTNGGEFCNTSENDSNTIANLSAGNLRSLTPASIVGTVPEQSGLHSTTHYDTTMSSISRTLTPIPVSLMSTSVSAVSHDDNLRDLQLETEGKLKRKRGFQSYEVSPKNIQYTTVI